MEVGLNSEQLSLRDTVRDILRTECPPDAARQAIDRSRALAHSVEDGRRSRLDRTRRAHSRGAGAFGPVELAVVLEECGAAIAPIPLLGSVGLAAGVLRSRPARLVLTDIAAVWWPRWPFTRPVHGCPGLPMTLRQGGCAARLSRCPTCPAPNSSSRLAHSDEGGTGRRRRPRGDGVTVMPAAESHRPRAAVRRRRDRCRAYWRRTGRPRSRHWRHPGAASPPTCSVWRGAALHRSIDYAKSRRQFGQPIGAFQGIKHALADNYVSVERARSLTYAAAARLADPTTLTTGCWTAAALAKAAASRRCSRLRAHRGPGARRAGRRPGNTTRTSMSGTPGRAPRCWATAARCTTRWAADSRGVPRDARRSWREFGAWLTDFLPDDYYANYRQYRWDMGVTARLPAGRVRGRMAAADLAPRAWRPITGLARRHGSPDRGGAAVRTQTAQHRRAGVAAPGIRQFGTPAQIDRLLVPLLRGDEWWALGMSEPESGSDFAGLRTRAERNGDVFRVNGHKIWTTQAHESQWCTLYARTDPGAPNTAASPA